eukprot:GHVU01046476.1.p1 GENE.GHVU01046476.1~~GHVU01046476.1.p1  ORF type:complete len:154 (-),score=17.78 GHVU01046476.1:801-1262(-)
MTESIAKVLVPANIECSGYRRVRAVTPHVFDALLIGRSNTGIEVHIKDIRDASRLQAKFPHETVLNWESRENISGPFAASQAISGAEIVDLVSPKWRLDDDFYLLFDDKYGMDLKRQVIDVSADKQIEVLLGSENGKSVAVCVGRACPLHLQS